MLAYGTVQQDKILIDYEYLHNFDNFQQKKISFEFETVKKAKVAYHYFYGVICENVAAELGITIDQARDLLTTELLTYELTLNDGSKSFATKSLSSLSKEEYVKFINNVEQYISKRWRILLPAHPIYAEYEKEFR